MRERREERFAVLRRRAESALTDSKVCCPEAATDVQQLVHELQVHQVELEIQNEELRQAQTRLEEAKERYLGLYDLAPVGYLVLDRQGVIEEANLTAAALLDQPRGELSGLPLARFLVADDRDRFRRELKGMFESGRNRQLELRLEPAGKKAPRWLLLENLAPRDAAGEAPRLLTVLTDIGALKHAEQELRHAHAYQRELIGALGEGLVAVDREGRLTRLNAEAERLLGWREAELLGRPIHPVIHHSRRDGSPNHDCALLRALSKGSIERVEDDVFVRRDGSFLPVAYVATPLVIDGQLEGAVTAFRDISEWKEAHERILLAYRALENTQEGVMLTDAQAAIRYVNPAFCRVTGYSEAEVLGQRPGILKSGRQGEGFYRRMWEAIREHGQWQGEIWNRRKDGEVYPEWLNISAIKDKTGQVSHYVGIFADISTQEQIRQRIHHLAYYDDLTNLPNRHLMRDRLEQALLHAKRRGARVALLFLDLDRFKVINDTLGHGTGDNMLQAVAIRLRQTLRATDTVSRLGGDEFVVLLEEIDDIQIVSDLARKVLEALARPFALAGQEFYVTTSVGISLFPADAQNAEDLLKNADAAMYRAKDLGRNNYCFFTPDMNTASLERLTLETGLRRALERDEFVLHYQPQWDLASGELIGVEALLRWQSPELGMVSPGQFIPLTEETGLIIPIGEWVLETACAQGQAWREVFGRPLSIAVNLSMRQMTGSDILATVRRVLARTGADPSCLELELTETLFMQNPDTIGEILHELRAMGVRLSIDDFGTGFSSLSYLKRLPIDSVKIAREFVRDIGEDPNDTAIVTAIIAMARSLRMLVLAEGVETEAQRDFLLAGGCERVQGFLMGRPVPAQEITELLGRQG